MSTICEKESFPTYEAGIDRMSHVNQRGDRHRCRLYKCPICGNYHLTTATKTLKKGQGRKRKYPINPDQKGKSIKFENVPAQKPLPRTTKPYHQQLATQKLLTKEQAEALKKVIDAQNQK